MPSPKPKKWTMDILGIPLKSMTVTSSYIIFDISGVIPLLESHLLYFKKYLKFPFTTKVIKQKMSASTILIK